MSCPRLFTTFLALLFSVAVPAAAAAQTVEIKAQPGVTVLAVTEDGRVPLGTVSPQGELHVPVRLLDRGTDYEIVLETVPEGTHVALVERGRTDPVCNSQARVTCVRTGTSVRWGRLDRISVSDAGQVMVEQDEVDTGGLRWRPGIIVGAEGARTFVSNDDRLCREARGFVDPGLGFVCDTESSTDAFGASVGVTVFRFMSLQAAYLDVGRLGFNLNGTADGTPVAISAGWIARAVRCSASPSVPTSDGRSCRTSRPVCGSGTPISAVSRRRTALLPRSTGRSADGRRCSGPASKCGRCGISDSTRA